MGVDLYFHYAGKLTDDDLAALANWAHDLKDAEKATAEDARTIRALLAEDRESQAKMSFADYYDAGFENYEKRNATPALAAIDGIWGFIAGGDSIYMGRAYHYFDCMPAGIDHESGELKVSNGLEFLRKLVAKWERPYPTSVRLPISISWA